MALLLDLTQLRGPREHVERSYPGTAFEQDGDEFRVVGDVALAFDVERQDKRYRLFGGARGLLELACSRCLEPLRWPVDATFDLRYLPMSANAGDDDQEVAEEDLGTAFY